MVVGELRRVGGLRASALTELPCLLNSILSLASEAAEASSASGLPLVLVPLAPSTLEAMVSGGGTSMQVREPHHQAEIPARPNGSAPSQPSQPSRASKSSRGKPGCCDSGGGRGRSVRSAADLLHQLTVRTGKFWDSQGPTKK